ncbi:hypothetical protein [Granulicella sibirica]|uniref:Uncharacterized protein n=1 Tax=Granulicella sibirica TaxID=2479048 RepID=A0A4Q0T331_9BACT|nr:hypothetical protein [Granulicella sibirica]RXH56870.1 hypothetical protein GRAN_0180 [Granulicella sibirica]
MNVWATDRVIEGRVATQADVDSRKCVFFIPDHRSLRYALGHALPVAAKITRPNDGSSFPAHGTLVQIVQAEIVDKYEILLGFVTDEMEGVCTLEDAEILNGVESN